MSINKYKNLVVILLLTGIAFIWGCSQSPQDDPKRLVISFFGAMEKNDQAALAHYLDLPEIMKNIDEDYALQSDTPRVFTNPKQILEDLTYNGVTKQRWFSYQRIINKVEVQGDNATVEVTFNDKERGIAYLTKFGLHKVNGKWKIYSFKNVK
jgi:hypothetical protein